MLVSLSLGRCSLNSSFLCVKDEHYLMQTFNYNTIMFENNADFKRTLKVHRDRYNWGGSKRKKRNCIKP